MEIQFGANKKNNCQLKWQINSVWLDMANIDRKKKSMKISRFGQSQPAIE